jgi:uncharacterized protein (TIGR03663 family)
LAGPAPSRRIFLFAAGLLLVGAAYLRFCQIERRPFHADEAVQAYQTWRLLRGDGYAYDPADRHGPFLYYAAAGAARMAGWSPAALDETRCRSVTLLAGLGTIAVLLGAAPRLGRTAALIGAALLAAAPLAGLYDTYFVQEAWLCFFTWALFFATLRWWDGTPGEPDQRVGRDRAECSSPGGRPGDPSLPTIPTKPTLAAAALIGTLAGLMQATKETSVLHFAALGAALLATRPLRLTESVGRLWPRALVALLTALFVYVLFYSSFFTRWAGVVDGLHAYSAYAARAAGGPHDQPWSYYFSMLWPHSCGGIHWGEPLLLLAALIGAVTAFTPCASITRRALAVFTLTMLLVYSIIPYKMPWLLLTPYVGLTLLAGCGAVQAANWLPAKAARLAPGLLGFALLLEGAWGDHRALGRYANDERNPYVYQPTSPDLNRLVTELGALPAGEKIAVISPDHAWPLPWYLRNRPAVGYFALPPANPAAYDLLLLDSRLNPPLPASATAFGLRPDVILWRTPR